MSRIKTLSDDIDVSVSTSYLIGQSGASGYVRTKIYENGIDVFSGLSYVTEGTDLIVNINDIASQNEYKKDYLKLQNNGELVSDPMIYNMIGTNNVRYRFNRGAISTYKVRLDGNDNTSETNIDVLCGYDYVNADLQPRCVADLPQYAWDTSLCRLMTGCQWIWIPEDDMGSFTNIPDDNDALPHYPFKYTNKYGIGLSLNHPGDYSRAAYCNTEFAIRLTVGADYNLGMTPFVTSNTTFCTLNNFLSYLGTHDNIDSDYNSSIYLKQYGTSGDAFGDYEEGVPDKYIGNCLIGILDRCPARYYLAWNDRYGDIQSQPFEGKVVYSEDIKSEEIVDYKLRRRVSHKSIQPKWKLNTKWLKDEVYPIYESMFTSPYVLLYDSEQDKAWNVIITDNKYTEKKYKNDKMFNLEINVEAIKTQELTY